MKTLYQACKHYVNIVEAYSNLMLVCKKLEDTGVLAGYTTLLKSIEPRIVVHDADKMLSIILNDSATYEQHDVHAAHHAAQWLIKGSVTILDFLEHLIDHIAVQMLTNNAMLVNLDQFKKAFPFERRKDPLDSDPEAFAYARPYFNDERSFTNVVQIVVDEYEQHVIRNYKLLSILASAKTIDGRMWFFSNKVDLKLGSVIDNNRHVIKEFLCQKSR